MLTSTPSWIRNRAISSCPFDAARCYSADELVNRMIPFLCTLWFYSCLIKRIKHTSGDLPSKFFLFGSAPARIKAFSWVKSIISCIIEPQCKLCLLYFNMSFDFLRHMLHMNITFFTLPPYVSLDGSCNISSKGLQIPKISYIYIYDIWREE